MSAKTVVDHKPSELRHEGTRDGIAVFSSASKSKATRNWTYVEVATLQVACECQAKTGTCWHCDLAPLALAMIGVASFVALLADAALAEVGSAAAATVAAGTHTVTDLAVLWQARVDHCRRQRARREVTALPADLAEALRELTTPTGKLLGCPDCGEPTRNPYLCTACATELMEERAREQSFALAA